jgi:hypothetical protein
MIDVAVGVKVAGRQRQTDRAGLPASEEIPWTEAGTRSTASCMTLPTGPRTLHTRFSTFPLLDKTHPIFNSIIHEFSFFFIRNIFLQTYFIYFIRIFLKA